MNKWHFPFILKTIALYEIIYITVLNVQCGHLTVQSSNVPIRDHCKRNRHHFKYVLDVLVKK